jgi:hypothetical protein
MKTRISCLIVLFIGTFLNFSADARIIRLEVLSVQSPTFGGLSFGTVGTYEKSSPGRTAKSIRPIGGTP